MNAFVNHFLFEFRTGIRNKTLLLMNYLFPPGFLCNDGSDYDWYQSRFLRDNDPCHVYFCCPCCDNTRIA